MEVNLIRVSDFYEEYKTFLLGKYFAPFNKNTLEILLIK